MAGTGVELLSALLSQKSPSLLRDIPDSFFLEGDERDAFHWLNDYYQDYQKFPSKKVFRRETKLETVALSEKVDYYIDRCRKRALYHQLTHKFESMQEALVDKDVDNAIQIAKEMVQVDLAVSKRKSGVQSVTAAFDEVFTNLDDLRFRDVSKPIGVPSGWLDIDRVTDGWQNSDLITVVGRPGAGKAQPLDALVHTEIGWRLFGELCVGDKLSSVDGKESVVTGIYPQGIKDVYKIRFTDGRSTECCGEHLWEVLYRDWINPRIVPTTKLIDMLKCKRYKRRLSIRLVSGDLNATESRLSLDPYIVGALIGDGCLTKAVCFSSADKFIVEKITDRVSKYGCTVVHRSKYDYAIVDIDPDNRSMTIIKRLLTDLDLFGKKSCQKRIPYSYLHASRNDRLELLQGLLDTDGTADRNGSISISVSNNGLSKDIQELVRSLGGTARISIKKTTHLDSYRIGIRYPNPQELFTLPRKKDRTPVNYQYANLRCVIDTIETIGTKECQCISVSHPSHLYITNEYIVTHNTFTMLWQAYHAWLSGRNVLFVSMEMGSVAIARRLLGVHSRVDPTYLRRGVISSKVERELREAATAFQGNIPFNLVVGNFKKSVDTIRGIAEDLIPDIIFVDASYLLLPHKKRSGSGGRREVVSDVVEELKMITIDINRPLVQSVQFNRQAKRLVTDNPDNPIAHLSLEKIGETDVVGQASSVVLGITDAPEPYNHTHRILGFLKGREGESGWWPIKYQFKPLDLSIQPRESIQPQATTNTTSDEDEVDVNWME